MITEKDPLDMGGDVVVNCNSQEKHLILWHVVVSLPAVDNFTVPGQLSRIIRCHFPWGATGRQSGRPFFMSPTCELGTVGSIPTRRG